MFSDLETIRQWIRVVLTISAICVTVFPLLYLVFSPWYRSHLGRAVMLQSMSIAFAIDFSAVYQYWAFTSDRLFLLTLWLFILVFIGLGSTYLTAALIYYNLKTRKERRNVRWNRRHTDKEAVSD